MNRQEQNNKLDAAIALIQEVAAAQTLTKTWCDTCHGAEYEDYLSYQLGTGLGSVMKKLKKLSWHDLEEQEAEVLAPGRR